MTEDEQLAGWSYEQARAELLQRNVQLQVALELLDELIDNAIDRWHDSTWYGSVPRWLGLTDEQYFAWVEGRAYKLVNLLRDSEHK
jgi:hypothetical protein